MPSPLRPDQIQHILKLYKIYLRKGRSIGEACEEIGQLYDRAPATIQQLVNRLLADTTNVAKEYIKANALKMTMKVVREGSVAQMMDILERPNIGVLAPKKQADQGSHGFFLTVQQDSCGAVKVGAAILEGVQQPALPAADTDVEDEKLWQETQAQLAEPVGTYSVVDGQIVESATVLDSQGRVNPAKTMKERGIGRSPTYQAAVERAKKRLEDAKEV